MALVIRKLCERYDYLFYKAPGEMNFASYRIRLNTFHCRSTFRELVSDSNSPRNHNSHSDGICHNDKARTEVHGDETAVRSEARHDDL